MSSDINATKIPEKRSTSKTVSVMLPIALADAIKIKARNENRLTSEVIRDILRENITTEPTPESKESKKEVLPWE